MNDEFCTLPTYGVIPAQDGLMGLFAGGVPGLDGIDVTRVSKQATVFLCYIMKWLLFFSFSFVL